LISEVLNEKKKFCYPTDQRSKVKDQSSNTNYDNNLAASPTGIRQEKTHELTVFATLLIRARVESGFTGWKYPEFI